MTVLETAVGQWILTAGVAMVPVIELRGAIPVGISAGLSPWNAYVAAVIGNFLPVPFIMLLVRRIFDWLRRGAWWGPRIRRLEARAHLKGRLVHQYRLPGLFLLVAIPLPGTGAWTGALVAALLDIRMRDAGPAILLGLLAAGGITLAITCGVFAVVS